jgi:hypothetical protein
MSFGAVAFALQKVNSFFEKVFWSMLIHPKSFFEFNNVLQDLL